MKKRIFLAVFLSAVMLLSLCACDDSGSGSETTSNIDAVYAITSTTTTTAVATMTTTEATTTTIETTTTTNKPTTTTKTTTTKEVTTTTPEIETIELFVKTTYYGVTGYFYKADINGAHDIFIDPTIVGLPADQPNFDGVVTEYRCIDDDIHIWFATIIDAPIEDTFNLVYICDAVDGGAGRFNVPVQVEGDIPFQTIKLREKTTYMGYIGYFYEIEHNSSSFEDPNEDPSILGLPANTPVISGLLTEYSDVYNRKRIYYSIAQCPHHDGSQHREDCGSLFYNKVLATGEPFRIWVVTK